MGMDWRESLKAYPINWLLEEENPSVRYFTLRDLMDDRASESELGKAKSEITKYGKIQKIFSKQGPEGNWEETSKPYVPKYRATYWQVMILSQLGLDKDHEGVRRACEFIRRFQLDEGGFSTFEKLKEGQTIREYEMSCLTGNVAASLIRLGYIDEVVMRTLKWLVEVQNRDGGWLCPYWSAHLRDKHGCFMGTITPLDAFSVLPVQKRDSEIEEAIKKGVEFLLMHRLFRADHHGFRVINGNWLKLGFPCFFYDVLRGLDVVARLGYARDDRIDDALDLLREKQNSDGSWTLESTPSGRMQVDLEVKNAPSKWVTLNALRVLKAVHEARN